MFSRVSAALTAVGLSEKYEKLFKDNELNDALVDHCLANKDDMSYIIDVIKPSGHRLQFINEFRKRSNGGSSSGSSCSSGSRTSSSNQPKNIRLICLDNDEEEHGSGSKGSNPMLQSSFINSNNNNSQSSHREFKILVKESMESSTKMYSDNMEEFLGGPGVFYDEASLLLVHKELKTKVLSNFNSAYKIYRSNVTKTIKVKTEDGEFEDVQMKLEQSQNNTSSSSSSKDDNELLTKQEELINSLENLFHSFREKNELRHTNFISKARITVSKAEKLYISQMTQFLNTCTDEVDLLDKEAHINQEAVNYLNDDIESSMSKTNHTTRQQPQFIKELNLELQDFIGEWFKGHLELFRLRREEDEVVVRQALMTAKSYYNEEMDKHFKSKDGYMDPCELSRLNNQISTAAFEMTKERNIDFILNHSQEQQLKEAIKVIFKKYEEENKMRRPTTSPAIGIDLGTTYSCVAVYINGKIQVIRNENGNNTTPSYVCFQDDGQVVAGDAAKDQSYRNPQNTIFDAKRLIGRKFNDEKVQENIKSWPFQVVNEGGKPKISVQTETCQDDSSSSNTRTSKRMKMTIAPRGRPRKNPITTSSSSSSTTTTANNNNDGNKITTTKTYHPEQISAQVLKKMKKIAEDYLGVPVKNAVITVPALFNDSQRQATRDAGEIAGLNVLRIINEPTAAAISYQLHRTDELKRNVLVFDLGGGTLDVSVLKICGGEIKVEAVHGDTHLGGEDFDGEMIKYCIDHFKNTHGVNLARGKNSKSTQERFSVSCRLRRIRNECERQKRVLSTAESTVVGLDVIDSASNHGNLDLHVPFTRELFESLNQKHFDKCIEIVELVLDEAKMTKSDINDIVLVGGSTRIPKIQNMLRDFFNGKALSKTINPDEAVAVGASIQACILNGEQVPLFKDSALKLMDVTPFSIGIENYKKEFVVQIPKNSRVPCQHISTWEIMKDFKTKIPFSLYEGEHNIATRNNLLGIFYLEGVPPKKAGEEKLKTTTRINEEGILSVQAVCVSNNVSNAITITAYKDRLSRQEIEQAKAST